MKKLLVLLVLLPLLVSFVVPVQAEDNGIEVVETVIEEAATNGCKSQTHKMSFQKDGVEVAWIKLTATNGCWNSLNMSLQNSTRTKWAASGYSWILLGAVLGGKSATRTTFTKYSNAELHMPGNVGYLTHQELRMVFLEPLNFHFSSNKTPVVFP